MKNLTQYIFTCSNAMFNYLKDNDLDKLIFELKRCEQHALDNKLGTISSDLWFKFGHDDTLATTINDIKRTLENPIRNQGNKELMLENFYLVTNDINPNNELRVYFS